MAEKVWPSYQCSNGHETTTPPDYKVLTKCPAYVHGQRCQGDMKRVGEGSRKGRAA